MRLRYEVFVTDEFKAPKDFPNMGYTRSFDTKEEATQYAKKYLKNSGRAISLTVCEVKYTEILEVEATVSVTYHEKEVKTGGES